MRYQKSIFIILEKKLCTCYLYEDGFRLNEREPVQKIYHFHDYSFDLFQGLLHGLKQFNLPIGRCFYGISADCNRILVRHFKKVFKGSHNLGVSAIKLKFAKIYLKYADIYFSGNYYMTDFKPRYDLSFQFFQKSVAWGESNYSINLYYLGYSYYFGLGTEIDYEKGYKLFEKIVESKKSTIVLGDALYYLGFAHKFGFYVEKNLSKAIPFFIHGKELQNQKCIEELNS
jgi:hypothetical protein